MRTYVDRLDSLIHAHRVALSKSTGHKHGRCVWGIRRSCGFILENCFELIKAQPSIPHQVMIVKYLLCLLLRKISSVLKKSLSDVIGCNILWVVCVKVLEQCVDFLVSEHRAHLYCCSKELGVIYLSIALVVYISHDGLDLLGSQAGVLTLLKRWRELG